MKIRILILFILLTASIRIFAQPKSVKHSSGAEISNKLQLNSGIIITQGENEEDTIRYLLDSNDVALIIESLGLNQDDSAFVDTIIYFKAFKANSDYSGNTITLTGSGSQEPLRINASNNATGTLYISKTSGLGYSEYIYHNSSTSPALYINSSGSTSPIRIAGRSSAPTGSTYRGEIYYNITDQAFYGHDESGWHNLSYPDTTDKYVTHDYLDNLPKVGMDTVLKNDTLWVKYLYLNGQQVARTVLDTLVYYTQSNVENGDVITLLPATPGAIKVPESIIIHRDAGTSYGEGGSSYFYLGAVALSGSISNEFFGSSARNDIVSFLTMNNILENTGLTFDIDDALASGTNGGYIYVRYYIYN